VTPDAAAAGLAGPPWFLSFSMASAGIIACAGVIAMVVGAARRWAWDYIAYAFACLPLGSAIALGGLLAQGVDTGTAARILQWQTTLTLVAMAALFWFAAIYTRQRSVLPWGAVVTAIAAILIAVNFAMPYGLRYATLEALPALTLPWGERVHRYAGDVHNVGYYFTRGVIFGIFLWIFVRSVIHYRAGFRRPAIYLAACAAVFTASSLQGFLADLGLVFAISASNVTSLALVGLLAVSLGLDLNDQAHALASTTRQLNRELDARREAESALEYRAYHDPVTRLANRARLEERLGQVVEAARAGGTHAALMVVNLDSFRTLKATYGHEVGDRILRLAGERLAATMPEGWNTYDLGGDEFAVLAAAEPGAQRMERLARDAASSAIDRLHAPMAIDERQLRVTVSVGITLMPGGAAGPADALRAAGIAMVEAKAAGGNRLALFEAAMERAARRRADLERGLREALESCALELDFQPQVDARGRIIGAEALLRWRHPELGMVPPGEFIPIAEKAGLIHAVGEWAVAEAARAIREAAPGDWSVSVNVSPWELIRPDYPERVERTLLMQGIDPRRLVVEVTEGVMVHRIEDVAANMGRLRELGVRMSIDDFGTGYSSLAYLRRLPVDQIKIDKAFVADLDHPDHHALVRTIADIGHALGLEVLAEGVETEEQRAILLALGCQGLQGYLLHRPLDAAAFRALLAGSPAQSSYAASGGQEQTRLRSP
jgi:diguanylate cyclase (GGDEF)-like protein